MSAVTPFGDTGWLVEVGDVQSAHRVAAAVEGAVADTTAPLDVLAVTVGFGSVVVTLDPAVEPDDSVPEWLGGLVATATDPGRSSQQCGQPAAIEIPVVFDGEDLAEVAIKADLTEEEVIDLLTGADLEVAFLGFAPGFPYLVGLPGPLAGLARRATPRVSVPAGSVAVAGGFAAVYPGSTPGGWQLLGRTEFVLFDAEVPPFARLRAGDKIRFRSVTSPPLTRVGLGNGNGNGNGEGRGGGHRPGHNDPTTGNDGHPVTRPVLAVPGERWLRVLEPGLLTLVQDAGRPSLNGLGVPCAGPADRTAMTLANRLMGNTDDAAALEVTARGPRLEVGADIHLAVVGAGPGAVELWLDGRPVPTDAVVPVAAGQVVTVGTVRSGLRAYVAVAGGLVSPSVAGSQSTDVLCGLGPGPLVTGDRLGIGTPQRPHGFLAPATDPSIGSRPVHVVVGPTPFDPAGEELRRLVATPWEVGQDANRIGLRLRAVGTTLRPPPDGIPSTGMLTGAIQVPPDGQPIVLLPDHATVGGYPVIATVITADLGRLGQFRAGDVVHFEEVTLSRAHELRTEQRRSMANRVSGWFPTDSGR